MLSIKDSSDGPGTVSSGPLNCLLFIQTGVEIENVESILGVIEEMR